MTSDLSQRYQDLGYLVVENLLAPEQTDGLRDRTRAIAEGEVPGYPRSDFELEPGADAPSLLTLRKLNRCAENDPVFFAHATNPEILDLVETLIGPDIKLFGSQCFMKPPGGIEKPYHQDSYYFTIEPKELVTCWTALDDVTLDNGCMWVIPGSHRNGIVPHEDWFIGDRPDKQVPDAAIDRASETAIVMPAGSCSFHHSVLLHRSAANRSERPRRGMAVHYMSAKSKWTHPDKPKPDYPLLRGREFAGCV
jgi:ectoine hydroxylase-related dioxygenase (phytanoyl-CoA dioxygenase family)